MLIKPAFLVTLAATNALTMRPIAHLVRPENIGFQTRALNARSKTAWSVLTQLDVQFATMDSSNSMGSVEAVPRIVPTAMLKILLIVSPVPKDFLWIMASA